MEYRVTSYNTKLIISNALKKFLHYKSFSKITVSEIIRECGINRKTFYYHFQDIYALLQWMLNEEAVCIVKHFDLLVDYEEAIRFVMDYVRENDYLVNCIKEPQCRDELKRFFYKDFLELILSVINKAEIQSKKRIDTEFKLYAARFYTEALAGMLVDWVINCDHQDKEKIVKYLTTVTSQAVNGMLDYLK